MDFEINGIDVFDSEHRSIISRAIRVIIKDELNRCLAENKAIRFKGNSKTLCEPRILFRNAKANIDFSDGHSPTIFGHRELCWEIFKSELKPGDLACRIIKGEGLPLDYLSSATQAFLDAKASCAFRPVEFGVRILISRFVYLSPDC